MHAGLSRNGAGTDSILLISERDRGLRRDPPYDHQKDQLGLGGATIRWGHGEDGNSEMKWEGAAFLRAFRFKHVPRSSLGNGNSMQTGLFE